MPYHSIDEILRRCRDRACPFWQVVLTTQAKETQLPESAVLGDGVLHGLCHLVHLVQYGTLR